MNTNPVALKPALMAKAILTVIRSPGNNGDHRPKVMWLHGNNAANLALVIVERLKIAASHLLDYYPHLTGRLQQNPITQAPEIGSLGTGAELWEAQCPRTLISISIVVSALSSRMLVFNLPGSGNAILSIFHSTVGSVSHNPVFVIQHTRFSCGGVALGIRVHHQVCDATGFMQLVRDLVEISSRSTNKSATLLRQHLYLPPRFSHIFAERKAHRLARKRKRLRSTLQTFISTKPALSRPTFQNLPPSILLFSAFMVKP